MKTILRISIVAVFFSCNEPSENVKNPFSQHLFSKTTQLKISVGYEDNAMPYSTFQDSSAWVILSNNLSQLLQNENIQITINPLGSGLINLGDIYGESYDRYLIEQLATDLQQHTSKDTIQEIIVLFLNGHFSKNDTPMRDIIGINIHGKPILAIFKPVINSVKENEETKALLEQATVLHEIGHAIGLVNNGLNTTSAHHDLLNGAHCTNTKCIMHWKNSGFTSLQFIRTIQSNSEIKLFGNECLTDLYRNK